MTDQVVLVSQRLNGGLRKEVIQGIEYLVAPVVAVKAGVLNGELLPEDELSRYVQAWNGRPIPLGHPTRQGEHVSANDLGVPNVGTFYNARFENGKLLGEAYFDPVKIEAAGPDGKELLRRLQANDIIDVSTAYWRDLEQGTGQLGGRTYHGIQHNLRPDHIAILLHEPGACSVHDGCGLPRANVLACNELRLCSCQECTEPSNDDTGAQPEGVGRVRQALATLSDFISRAEPASEQDDDPETTEEPMDEMIQTILANERNKLTEEQLREIPEAGLQAMSDLLAANEEELEEEVTEESEEETEETTETEESEEETEEEAMPAWASTLAATVKGLSDRVDQLSANAQSAADRERSDMITALVANKACPFSKEDLQGFDTAQLRKLSSAFAPADYSGRGGTHLDNQDGPFVEMPALVGHANGR